MPAARLLLGLALALGAAADSTDAELGFESDVALPAQEAGRRLQAGGRGGRGNAGRGNAGRGGQGGRGGAVPGRRRFDINVCASEGVVDDDPNSPDTVYHGTGENVMRPTGTIHDDATDRVDCSQGACSGVDTGGNGYADNLDCHKTIVAPPGNTISLTFSHMALEAGAPCGQANGGVGCDVVTLYDGADIYSPVIGTFSGTDLPAAQVSTQNLMTVRFQTDAGNYGFQVAGVDSDPGFYADWNFIDHLTTQGDGICPAPAVYTDPHGTIRDDERSGVNCAHLSQQCGSGSGDAGYGDNTHCYTTIHAPEGDQVRLTFTQMNLEQYGCHPNAGPGMGCPEGGCDFVQVFDGQDANSPMIGQYTGYLNGADLPSVVSSGEWMRIEFHTDQRNCGITNGEDPGWFADWDFVSNGENICEPSAAVLRTEQGVLHDDDTSTATSFEQGGSGYGDNLDCGVRIRGGKGATINLHVVQMSLEGDGYGICDENNEQYIGHSCDDNGGDFLYVYDGRDENAPLLAQLNGSPTDQVLMQDTFTTTGRDMYVRFTTDAGNYGLTNTIASPGFYAEWSVLDNGQECDTDFRMTPGMGIVGHNNEQLSGKTPEQCMAECCMRDWCQSFDYIASMAGGTCNLADVDASTSFGSTGPNRYNNLYERAHPLPALASPGGLGPNGCAQMLQQISQDVNHMCCPHGGCARGVPDTCSEDCAGHWMPFTKQCSQWLAQQSGQGAGPDFSAVTEKCERQMYGRYRAGSNHGRCSDGDLATYTAEFQPACCGGNMEYCPGVSDPNDIVQPTRNGQAYCSPGCAAYVEEMYSECHPRFQTMMTDEGVTYNQVLEPFLAVCQGVTPAGPAGGGHRRQLGEDIEDYDESKIV